MKTHFNTTSFGGGEKKEVGTMCVKVYACVFLHVVACVPYV